VHFEVEGVLTVIEDETSGVEYYYYSTTLNNNKLLTNG